MTDRKGNSITMQSIRILQPCLERQWQNNRKCVILNINEMVKVIYGWQIVIKKYRLKYHKYKEM